MSWSGHIADTELARRAGGNAIIADTDLGMGTSDLATLATAQAAATANAANRALVQICDLAVVQQCSKAFKIGSNMSATFGSTFAAYEASLPDSTGHKRQLYS